MYAVPHRDDVQSLWDATAVAADRAAAATVDTPEDTGGFTGDFTAALPAHERQQLADTVRGMKLGHLSMPEPAPVPAPPLPDRGARIPPWPVVGVPSPMAEAVAGSVVTVLSCPTARNAAAVADHLRASFPARPVDAVTVTDAQSAMDAARALCTPITSVPQQSTAAPAPGKVSRKAAILAARRKGNDTASKTTNTSNGSVLVLGGIGAAATQSWDCELAAAASLLLGLLRDVASGSVTQSGAARRFVLCDGPTLCFADAAVAFLQQVLPVGPGVSLVSEQDDADVVQSLGCGSVGDAIAHAVFEAMSEIHTTALLEPSDATPPLVVVSVPDIGCVREVVEIAAEEASLEPFAMYCWLPQPRADTYHALDPLPTAGPLPEEVSPQAPVFVFVTDHDVLIHGPFLAADVPWTCTLRAVITAGLVCTAAGARRELSQHSVRRSFGAVCSAFSVAWDRVQLWAPLGSALLGSAVAVSSTARPQYTAADEEGLRGPATECGAVFLADVLTVAAAATGGTLRLPQPFCSAATPWIAEAVRHLHLGSLAVASPPTAADACLENSPRLTDGLQLSLLPPGRAVASTCRDMGSLVGRWLLTASALHVPAAQAFIVADTVLRACHRRRLGFRRLGTPVAASGPPRPHTLLCDVASRAWGFDMAAWLSEPNPAAPETSALASALACYPALAFDGHTLRGTPLLSRLEPSLGTVSRQQLLLAAPRSLRSAESALPPAANPARGWVPSIVPAQDQGAGQRTALVDAAATDEEAAPPRRVPCGRPWTVGVAPDASDPRLLVPSMSVPTDASSVLVTAKHVLRTFIANAWVVAAERSAPAVPCPQLPMGFAASAAWRAVTGETPAPLGPWYDSVHGRHPAVDAAELAHFTEGDGAAAAALVASASCAPTKRHRPEPTPTDEATKPTLQFVGVLPPAAERRFIDDAAALIAKKSDTHAAEMKLAAKRGFEFIGAAHRHRPYYEHSLATEKHKRQ